MENKKENCFLEHFEEKVIQLKRKKILKRFFQKVKKSLEEKKIEYHTLIINKIIRERRNAIFKIINFLYSAVKNIKEKREIIIKRIRNERKFFSQVLQNNIRYYLMRKKVNLLLEKEKDHFCLICKIKNVKKVYLNVFIEKGQTEKLEFEFCKLRKVFVIYIQRELAQGNSFRVNFIADEKIVIDPEYRTDYDESGNFYNLIDFVKIENKEKAFIDDRIRTIRYYKSQIMKQKELEDNYFKNKKENDEDSSSSDDEEEVVDSFKKSPVTRAQNFSDDRLFKLNKGKHSFACRENNILSRSIMNMKNYIKPLSSLSSLISKVKPILKSPNSASKNSLPKRVSFGKVEFSF